jgi:hypothetical protein
MSRRPPDPGQVGLDLGSPPASRASRRARPRSSRPALQHQRQFWAPVGGRDYDGLASGRYLFLVEMDGQIAIESRSGAVLWRVRGALDQPGIWSDLNLGVVPVAAVLRLDVGRVRRDLDALQARVGRAAATRAAFDAEYLRAKSSTQKMSVDP